MHHCKPRRVPVVVEPENPSNAVPYLTSVAIRQWTGLGRFELPKLADANPFSADTIPGFAVWIIPCFTETTHTSHSTIAFKLNSWLICHFGALLLYSLCGSPVFNDLSASPRWCGQTSTGRHTSTQPHIGQV